MLNRTLLIACMVTIISFSCTVCETQAATAEQIGGNSAVTSITGLVLENLYYPGNIENRDAVFTFDHWYNIWDQGELNFISSAQAEIFAQAVLDTVSGLSFVNDDWIFADKDWTAGGRNSCYIPFAIDQGNNKMSVWKLLHSSVTGGFHLYELTGLSLDNSAFDHGMMFAVARMPSEVPVPGTFLLLGSATLGLFGIKKGAVNCSEKQLDG